MNKKLPVIFIFSSWIYIISILYFFDLFPYSPLFSNILMVAFLPSLIVFSKKLSFSFKCMIILFEFSFLALVLSKGVKMDYVFNYFLLILYLILLAINNKSMCDIYCRELPNTLEWLSKRFSKSFCAKDIGKAYSIV